MARSNKRGRLTDSYAESLSKPNFYRDGLLPGFGVRVGRRKKTWGLRIERKGREKIFETLSYCPDMKADEARAVAHDMLARYERRERIKSPRQPGHGPHFRSDRTNRQKGGSYSPSSAAKAQASW